MYCDWPTSMVKFCKVFIKEIKLNVLQKITETKRANVNLNLQGHPCPFGRPTIKHFYFCGQTGRVRTRTDRRTSSSFGLILSFIAGRRALSCKGRNRLQEQHLASKY